MNRASTSKVERSEYVQPAVGVPGPVSDWAIADGDPAEPEDDGWQDATTLEGASYNDHGCAGGEHELVEGEDNVGKHSGTPRWCRQCLY